MITNMTPVAKLMPPIASITAMKPGRPSDRCGVISAANNVGSRRVAWSGALPSVMPFQYRWMMAKKTTPRKKSKPKPKRQRKPPAKARKAAPKKPATPKRWSEAEIAEAFRRFHLAHPQPRGELQHVNPYTLLVAVVLSAQATDAGVNKATPALFAAA